MEERGGPGQRSFFWPVVLIGVGLIWLLANLRVLPTPNVRLLIRLWPLVLIAIGLEVLIGRRSPLISALIGFGVVGLAIALMALGSNLGIELSDELKTLTFSEPLGSTESARIDLDLERYQTTVEALDKSDVLIGAELDTFTDVDFSVRGEREKTVSLRPVGDAGFDFGRAFTIPVDARWEIGLSPVTPLDLSVDVGSGSARLDLMGLELTGLRIVGGSGSMDLYVPAADSRYPVRVNGGSGSFDIEVEMGSDLEADFSVGSGSFDVVIGAGVAMELDIDGGSGSIAIDVPDDAGVRLTIDHSGSGSVSVPSEFNLVDDDGDDDRETGIWESEGFSRASRQIEITFDPGSGSFTLR